MKYEKAKAEVVLFDNSDVITTSDGEPECSGNSVGHKRCPNGNFNP